MIVNGVDTDLLHTAAARLRGESETTQVTLRLSAGDVSTWLRLAALTADASRLGGPLPDLHFAADVARQILEA